LERLKQVGFRMIKLHPNTQRLDAGAKSVAAASYKLP
jgi:hypothetical protein